MNFQQLRILRETVRRNFNLTEVANALNASQSGVSKHIKDLEDELGVELFVRRGKRLTGLTNPAGEIIDAAERILLDVLNIKQIADQYGKADQGELIVVTTHTQARFALPAVVPRFKQAFPKVRLVLQQANPVEVVRLLLDGRADIGIATEAIADSFDLVSFPFYSWHHAVIVPLGHPLEKVAPLTLQEVARHPILTYHEGMTGRSFIDYTFSQAGIVPDIVMSALDSDVIKTYVALNQGVGIVASVAIDPTRDTNLAMLDSRHLFVPRITRIAVRRGHFLRGFAYRFIELCLPELTEQAVRAASMIERDDHYQI